MRPITTPPLPNGAPAFAIEASGALSPAAPLGSIDYAVEERTLPALTEFKIEMDPSLGAFMADVAGIEATALSSDGPALHALLRARAALLEAAEGRCTVAFTGTETGRVTATVTPRSGGSPGSTTGLEGSAVGGQGFGIEPFRRQARQQVRSSTGGFNIMLDGNSQLSTASGAVASSTTPSPTPTADGVVVQPWSQDAATQRTAPPQRGIADAFAAILTQRYAVFQGAAGRTVGISPGAAWRIALEAAAAAGSSQIYLGDRPASVTGRRLAQGIWSSSAPFLLGAVPAAIAAAIVTSEGLGAGGSPLAPLFAALLPLVAGVWPVASPLVEVWRFSRLSASDIEDVVRLKEPLQRPDGSSAPQMVFWGEDALLKWPGAMEPVIHERDEFMARAMAAAVTGAPEGLTPAFVRSQAGVTGSGAAQQTFRYAMPQGADPVVCPIGDGDGTFVPKPAKKLVAVVGTAHVAGIMEAWRRAQAPGADLSLKKLA